MSQLGKALFVLTALAPILFALIVNDLYAGKGLAATWPWITCLVSLVLIWVCVLIFAYTQLGRTSLSIKKVETADKETLSFLLAYLLPILAKDYTDLRQNTPTAIYIYAILFFAVYYSNSFHFNPLLAFVGFHFYEIETEDDMPYVLISRAVLKRQKSRREVVKLSEYVYLDVTKE